MLVRRSKRPDIVKRDVSGDKLLTQEELDFIKYIEGTKFNN